MHPGRHFVEVSVVTTCAASDRFRLARSAARNGIALSLSERRVPVSTEEMTCRMQ